MDLSGFMYSAENYLWGWVGYGLGVILLLLAVWGITRGLRWPWLRHGLLLVLTALLLTPMQPYPESSFLAPAIFVSVFEGLSHGFASGFARGLPPIGVIVVVLLSLYTCCAVLWRRWR